MVSTITPQGAREKGSMDLHYFIIQLGLCSQNGKAFALQKASCRAGQFKPDASQTSARVI